MRLIRTRRRRFDGPSPEDLVRMHKEVLSDKATKESQVRNWYRDMDREKDTPEDLSGKWKFWEGYLARRIKAGDQLFCDLATKAGIVEEDEQPKQKPPAPLRRARRPRTAVVMQPASATSSALDRIQDA